MARERVIVFADKTVLSISGMKVEGLDTVALEQAVSERIGSPARLIGVTGDALRLDVYGLPPEQIRRNEAGILEVVAAAEGITAADVMKMVSAEKAVPVDISDLPDPTEGCRGERWRVPHDR